MTDKKTIFCLSLIAGSIAFVMFGYDYLADLLPWRAIATYSIIGLGVAILASFAIMIRREQKRAKVEKMAEEWEKQKKGVKK